MNDIPDISFTVYSRGKVPDWLLKKKKYLETKWNANKDGIRLIKKIMRTCNLTFPSPVLNRGINVITKKYSLKKHGDILGFVSPTKPTKITIFVKEKDRYYPTLKSTLCHELIHSLMWTSYYFDQRRTIASLFADIFADELLTTMLEESIIKGKMSKIDFEWAFDYASQETYNRLKNLKKTKEDYKKILDELKAYLREYKRAIKRGSHALRERQRALRDICSPLPLELNE